MNQVHGTPFYDPKQPIVFWRENLPHWHQTGKITFITFRLNDSMPQVIVRQYREVKEQFIRTHPYPWDAETFRQYDELLSGPMQK